MYPLKAKTASTAAIDKIFGIGMNITPVGLVGGMGTHAAS
jgi:hypothetical protein